MIKKLSMSLVLITLGISQTQATPKTWNDTFFGSNTRKTATLTAGIVGLGSIAAAVNYFRQDEAKRSVSEASKSVITGPWNWVTENKTHMAIGTIGAAATLYGLYKYFSTDFSSKPSDETPGSSPAKPIDIDTPKQEDTSKDAELAQKLQEEEFAKVTTDLEKDAELARTLHAQEVAKAKKASANQAANDAEFAKKLHAEEVAKKKATEARDAELARKLHAEEVAKVKKATMTKQAKDAALARRMAANVPAAKKSIFHPLRRTPGTKPA